jgi:hypothetical protein
MQVQPIPSGKRTRTPASTRMLQEWVGLRYPGAQVWYELRLGPTSRDLIGVTVSPNLEAMLRVANWYADAVIYDGNELVLVEAKIEPNPSALGQVLWYYQLIRTTPVLSTYATAPVVPVVLFGEDDATLNAWVRSMGIRVELYTPPWIAEYLVNRQFRNRRTNSV